MSHWQQLFLIQRIVPRKYGNLILLILWVFGYYLDCHVIRLQILPIVLVWLLAQFFFYMPHLISATPGVNPFEMMFLHSSHSFHCGMFRRVSKSEIVVK